MYFWTCFYERDLVVTCSRDDEEADDWGQDAGSSTAATADLTDMPLAAGATPAMEDEDEVSFIPTYPSFTFTYPVA